MTHKRDVGNELKKIFSYHKGEDADLGKIEMSAAGGGWKKLAILFFGAGFLLSLLWGGFLLLGRGPASGSDIKITFDGPSNIEPMKEYDFTATLENVSNLALTRVTFGLDLPDQFFLTSSDPGLDPRHQVTIGDLAKKEKHQIHFKGSFVAKEKDSVSIGGSVVYHPQNFNASFEASGNYTATMSEGVLTGSVDGPDKLLSGDEATFTLFYSKKENLDQTDLAISLDAPSDFVITTSTLQPARENIWPLALKDKATENQVVFKGRFSSDANGDRTVKFLLGQVRDTRFFPTKEIDVPIEVLGSELGINVTLNGTALKDLSNPTFMRFGDLLSYAIDVSSTSKETLKNMRVIFHAEGAPEVNGENVVLWSSAFSSPNGNRDTNSVVWTSNDIGSFKNFKPNASEHIEGTVRLRAGPLVISSTDYRVRIWAEVQLDAVGKIVKKRILTSKVGTIAIQSDTTFNNEARYYGSDGVALSTGPLPPHVGEETTYRVFWRVSNSLHGLSNVVISAPLGEHVRLTGKNLIPAGVFSYDSASHIVTWSLDQWPASLKNTEINFEVGLTPTSADVGKTPDLLGPATFTARDTVTGADINLAAPSLTTDVKNDSLVGSKTAVTQ